LFSSFHSFVCSNKSPELEAFIISLKFSSLKHHQLIRHLYSKYFVACPSAFEVTVTVLVNAPTLSVAYFTPIIPFAPGAIGSLEK
jgi:hypothetical protein